jgi:Protein of unknown function (DUF2934)
MSTTPSGARPKRPRTPRNGAEQAQTTEGRTPATTQPAPTSPAEQRHALIAEHAYRRAELRGFQGGDPVADWLESEKEVDALLRRSTN